MRGWKLSAGVEMTVRRWWPEGLLVVVAALVFLGALGSPGLWGKREQRAAAEALDTIDQGHWLVARIQDRPRLEKPPLPRWLSAAVMGLTGSRDEWAVRLPNALAGLATLALVYALGLRLGDRSVARAAASILVTTGLFVAELRQAGNDGMLTLFTTLALYAACRLLDGEPSRGRFWAIGFHAALGLGFLSKGPVILLLVGVTVVPYLIVTRRLGSHKKRLLDGWGVVLFGMLALGWPALVLIDDPRAAGVWLTEIGQKTGALPIAHRGRELFLLQWPLMVLPWVVAAAAGVALPFWRRALGVVLAGSRRSEVWFPWWWAVGNLAMIQCWAVAKPGYYVPCLPGAAVLAGMGWVALCRVSVAQGGGASIMPARWLLQAQWVVLLLMGTLTPVATRSMFPDAGSLGPVVIALALGLAVWLGVRAWRRGSDALSLVPVAAVGAVVVLIGYGLMAPVEDRSRSHRELARRLEDLLPAGEQYLGYFPEIDEGLWFYLKGRTLVPASVDGPRYSPSHDRVGSRVATELGVGISAGGGPGGPRVRHRAAERRALREWLAGRSAGTRFLLIRETDFRRHAEVLAGLVNPVYREEGVNRSPLVLLRLEDHAEIATTANPTNPPLR